MKRDLGNPLAPTRRQRHLLRIIKIEKLLRRHLRHMWPNEAAREKERPILVLVEQTNRFIRSLIIVLFFTFSAHLRAAKSLPILRRWIILVAVLRELIALRI